MISFYGATQKAHDHITRTPSDVSDISADSAPLKAIMFLKKADKNRLIPLKDKKIVAKKLLHFLISPFATSDWWSKTLVLIERICNVIPCYVLEFDKNGNVMDVLKEV